jgi:serine/threonine protein kinase
MEESEIFGGSPRINEMQTGFHDFKLLKTNAKTRLYLAHKSGKRFVIKTTKDESELQKKILQREYELSIDCDHPNLVHIYTLEEGFPFGVGLVMEYIEGRTLDEYIKEHPSRKERNRIFTELLSAVEYLHKRGIVHNDIKPENIIITRTDNTLKLIDFGLADNDAHYVLRTLGCSPRYASPELLNQSGEVDARSDIYSIGLLMRELLGGSLVANRCTKQLPKKRYANVGQLRKAWSNRYLPFRILLAFLLLTVCLLPTFLLIQTKIAEQERRNYQEQVITQMERKITNICEAAKDSMEQSKYFEFANMHMLLMMEQCRESLDSITSNLDDTDLKMLVNSRYQLIFGDYCKEIAEIPIVNKPMYTIVTPREHHSYYDSLIANQLPYQPYPMKK